MKTAKTKEIVKFDVETAVIVALDAKYKDLTITDGKSYAVVMQGIAEYRELRIRIDGTHKELKKDALEYGRAVDAEKNRLKALLEPGENHLKEIRQIEDDRKDAIKAENEAKERERIEAIQEKINSIRDLGIMPSIVSSLVIEERLIIIKGMMVTQEVYQEFTMQAEDALNSAIATLEEALTQRLQFEKEETERKAEAERLETQRKEQEAAQQLLNEAAARHQAKVDEENRKIEEEKAKIADEKKAEEDRKKQEEWEKDEKARILLELEERKAEAEQKQIEREEAEAKEKARIEALKPDKEKLIKWIGDFNDRIIPTPRLKSKEANRILKTAQENIEMVLQDAMTATEEL